MSVSKADNLQNRETAAIAIANEILPLIGLIFIWVT